MERVRRRGEKLLRVKRKEREEARIMIDDLCCDLLIEKVSKCVLMSNS